MVKKTVKQMETELANRAIYTCKDCGNVFKHRTITNFIPCNYCNKVATRTG